MTFPLCNTKKSKLLKAIHLINSKIDILILLLEINSYQISMEIFNGKKKLF